MNDIILTGVPRSGTTLSCLLLSQIPNMVALNEPIQAGKFRTKREALKGTKQFFADTRHSLLTRKVATAKAKNGKMTDNHFSNDPHDRKKLISKQEIRIEKALTTDFNLGLKHNALFTVLLDELVTEYPFFALIRNPFAVLASWNSLNIPASRGSVRAAKWLGPDLFNRLEKMEDVHDRQLHILDWYFRQYTKLAASQVIRYEDMIATNGSALSIINEEAKQLTTPLNSKNKNKVYDREIMSWLSDKLLASDNACWEFYSKNEVEQLRAEF